ncbi:MAG: hypothetical protein H6661_12145 [Ardenticatenaceae bacterium]|nr:hypothetical protein [Ardenticatenaceae bacterium]
MILYFLMAVLFISLAVLEAFNAAFVGFNLLPWFNGMRWLRIHLITLGTLTEVIFGVLPGLVALHSGLPKPKFRWDIWLLLNGGLLTLLVGIPLVNAVPIIAGGTLVFLATLLLLIQLVQLRAAKPAAAQDQVSDSAGRKFYLAGLAYFLLGIFIGTGLWLGWLEPLSMQAPLETHIHANNWGLMSLVFAGLIVDFYPQWAKRPLAWPRSLNAIFWMMVLGAAGLIAGPWLNSLYFTVPGLILHVSATGWLLLNVIWPIRRERAAWTPGMWHLVTSYVWILAPILVAPLIIVGVPGIPGLAVEQNAPQALIYGWVLQFGFAVIPFFFRRAFLPGETAVLGGNWFSLAAVHLGGLFLWLGIFILPLRGLLHGVAYALWGAAMIPVVLELWRIVRAGWAQLEQSSLVASAAD